MLRFLEKRLARFQPAFPETLFKGVLWAMVFAVVVGPLAVIALPFIEFFNDMAAQPKAKSQGTYGRIFGEAEKDAFRPPPPRTLPRGVELYRLAGREEEDLARAEKLLSNPQPRTRESFRRGREIYGIFCIACHGKRGEADGPVVGPDLYPAPTILHDKSVIEAGDGRIFHVITHGYGKMQGYGDKVAIPDRWHLVNYVRVLQRANDPRPEDYEK
jgi:mono/diheme cytochrome c family protein